MAILVTGGAGYIGSHVARALRLSGYEGVIYDIVPDQRIVYSYEMYVGQDLGSVSLATVEIVAEGSGTKLTYTEQGAFLDGIEKPEDRQQLGWMFDNFGKYLASSAGH